MEEQSLNSSASTTNGLFAPAEEAAHARTWMCWASTQEIYGPSTSYFESVQETLGRIAAAIAEHEPVTMLAAATDHELVQRLCGPKVDVLDIATDDMWARDSGPVFLKSEDDQHALLDFNFNGWGDKERHANDNLVAIAIAKALERPHIRASIVGEGGGVEFDGEGTLILTDSCWVNDNRNPGMSKAEIEMDLKAALGVEKVIWVPGVRDREITDGHIDGSIRIVRPGLLVTGGFSNDTTEWGLALAESRAILAKETDAKGRPFTMVDIPSAIDVRSTHHDFFTGYANYYVGNGAVYTPQFGDSSADTHAAETLGRMYPDRQIVVLDVDRIYENGGGIHCVTQQEPL